MSQASSSTRALAPATDAFFGTSRRHTSEPRWSQARPAVDPAARMQLIVAGADPRAVASARAWASEAGRHGAQVRRLEAAPAELADEVFAAVTCAPVTARLLVAGDEALIGRTLAGALAGGLRVQEIAVQLTDPQGPRLVQCVHCRALTETDEPVESECACAGCGVPLLIFPHFSRRIGAYLAFRRDAEELG